MKLANLGGRATFVTEAGAAGARGIDVEAASGGRFGPDVQGLFDNCEPLRDFARGLDATVAAPLDPARLGSPVPAPRQVFAIGLNYRSHAEEAGMAVPAIPATFTQFPA